MQAPTKTIFLPTHTLRWGEDIPVAIRFEEERLVSRRAG